MGVSGLWNAVPVLVLHVHFEVLDWLGSCWIWYMDTLHVEDRDGRLLGDGFTCRVKFSGHAKSEDIADRR